MHRHQQKASAKLAGKLRLVVAVAAVVVSACGSSSSPVSVVQSAHYPLTVAERDGRAVTITQQPRHIVSLSPTATEMLFAIGAGPQVVAVDDQSNYPANAPMTKLSGFQPNIEAIAGYSPDLVVASQDLNGLVHGITALNIPLLLEPAAKNLADSYAQITELGAVTGHIDKASALVTSMKSQVASFVSTLSKPKRQLKVYHELDNTYYSATSATFIGQIYKVLGLQNIADGATAAAPDYPQLSAEYIVSSNPDLIVLADTICCNQNLSSVGARPGWGAIAAVKDGQVIGVDDDIASRWGPRVIDFMQAIAPHVLKLEQAA
jgi:iron complex transport system substrate-binding protein